MYHSSSISLLNLKVSGTQLINNWRTHFPSVWPLLSINSIFGVWCGTPYIQYIYIYMYMYIRVTRQKINASRMLPRTRALKFISPGDSRGVSRLYIVRMRSHHNAEYDLSPCVPCVRGYVVSRERIRLDRGGIASVLSNGEIALITANIDFQRRW